MLQKNNCNNNKKSKSKSKKGLASASAETRAKIAHLGGIARHVEGR